jgi:NO-binding membrane sensor protein with MHYT domain
MLKRAGELSFVIGIFFFLVSLILFGNLLAKGVIDRLTLYSASVFLVFGLSMMFLTGKKK